MLDVHRCVIESIVDLIFLKLKLLSTEANNPTDSLYLYVKKK